MPTVITIDGVTLTLKKYPEFAAQTPTATDIILFSDDTIGDLKKTTMDGLIAAILNVDGVTITGDGSSGNPLVAVTGGGGLSAANNGTSVSGGTTVQLGDTTDTGSPLLHNTFIYTDTFDLTMLGGDTGFSNAITQMVLNKDKIDYYSQDNGDTTDSSFRFTNTGLSQTCNSATTVSLLGTKNDVNAVVVYAKQTHGGISYHADASGTGFKASDCSVAAMTFVVQGNGITGQSDGYGIDLIAGGSYAASYNIQNASNNNVKTNTFLSTQFAGDVADGFGTSLDFQVQPSTGGATNPVLSNQIISKWTTAASASRTSQIKVTGVLSASTVDLMTLNSDGSWQIRPITATAASAITPAEGMIVFVSNTNGTFTSIGFWGYQNGAWAAF